MHDALQTLASQHTFMNQHPWVLAMLFGIVVAGLMALVALFLLLRLRRRLTPFERTFESAAVGITHTALDGKWLRVNDRMLDITGYSREELMGMTYSELTLESDRAMGARINRQIVDGEIGSFSMQKRYRRKDGRIIWAKVSASLARKPDGSPDYYISVVEDIDELKRSEIAREENEARFRAFWDNSPFNQSVKDTRGRLVEVNKTYRTTFGISDREVTGQSLAQTHRADWAPEVDDFDREVLQSRTTRTADIKVPGKDGEDRFRATFEQAAVGIAHTAIDGQWLRINERLCQMLGYTEAELRKLSFEEITHHDDIEADVVARDAMLAGETDVFVRKKRYLRKDGTPIWVQITGSKTEKIGDVEPYVIIVVEDIAERVRAEAALAARLLQQATVVKIGQRALSGIETDDLLQATAEIVADTLEVDACLISRLVRPPAELEIVAASAEGKKYLGWVVEPRVRDSDEVYAGIAMDAVIYDNSDPNSPDLDTPILRDFGTVSGASAVIEVDNATHGVIVVHSRSRHHFTNDDLTFLKSVAYILSASMTRNRMASSLAEREQMLNTVLDTAADGIVVADSAGQIVLANRASEEIFGHADNALLGKNLRDLVPITYQSQKSGTGQSSRPQFSTREMIGVKADGERFPIEVAMSNFDSPAGMMHTALLRDITEQKSLQSQLVQASKLATVGEMAAGIAHELNQPLNIMRMAADNVLIRVDSGTADLDYAAENLSLISEQAGRMGKIILHMRVFSRQDTTDFQPFDPARAVRNAIDLIGRQLELDNVALNVDIATEGTSVSGIESQLEQVLINMITNARDAIRENAPAYSNDRVIGSVEVTLEEMTDENCVCIRVSDTGGGIAESTLERIFDPFFTTKDVGVGTGLGLSVSYGIVSSMGGSITAQNIEGGCEFRVKLPMVSLDAEPADADKEDDLRLPAQELR